MNAWFRPTCIVLKTKAVHCHDALLHEEARLHAGWQVLHASFALAARLASCRSRCAHDPLLTIHLLLIHVPLIGSGSNAPPALALRRAGAGPGVAGAS